MRIILKYSFWICLTLVFLLILNSVAGISSNSFIFTIIVLYLLFFPGWLLSRIFRYRFDDILTRILSRIVLSFGFYFLIAFGAIVLKIDFQNLINLYIVLISLIFMAALVLDLIKPAGREDFSFFKNLSWEKLYYLIPLLLGLLIIWVVSLTGPNLNGDPYFHLAIIQKAADGGTLGYRELAFTKTNVINPAYTYPVWHVFLASLAKIFSVSISTVWSNIVYALIIITILVWYFLAKTIFIKKEWAILALSCFLIFTFYAGPGYLFSRLGVPDTLAQLIFLPLAIAFSLKYIFEADRKLLLPVLILSLILILIHAPHYFYLLLTIVFFGIIFVFFKFKDQEGYTLTRLQADKKIILKIAIGSGMILLPLILILLVIEFHSRAFSSALLSFSNVSNIKIKSDFRDLGLLYKYGYFLLPFVALFWRQKRAIFLLSSLILAPLIYWTPLKDVFTKTLSIVFTDRLLANTSWYFFIFTLVLIVGIVSFDRLNNRFSVNGRKLVKAGLILLILILTYLEFKNDALGLAVYNLFYSKTTAAFVTNNTIWLMLISLAVLVIFWFLSREKKVSFAEAKVNDHLTGFMLIFLISFIFLSPSFANIGNILAKPKPPAPQQYFLNLVSNDEKSIAFVKTNTFSNSVILASSDASKGLSVLTGRYMAYNVGSAYEDKFDWVFDPAKPDEVKTKIVISPQWAIDYIYLDKPVLQNSHFKAHPELYELVYADRRYGQISETEIYRVIK